MARSSLATAKEVRSRASARRGVLRALIASMTACSMPTASAPRTCANHGQRAFQRRATTRLTICCSRRDNGPDAYEAPRFRQASNNFGDGPDHSAIPRRPISFTSPSQARTVRRGPVRAFRRCGRPWYPGIVDNDRRVETTSGRATHRKDCPWLGAPAPICLIPSAGRSNPRSHKGRQSPPAPPLAPIASPAVSPQAPNEDRTMSRPPLPPFTAETAAQKARMAEDAWNTRDPARVALAYTTDSRWRNRSEFLQGRAAIEAFLTRKWSRELDYRLIKEVWTYRENRIAVRFAYEWHDDSGNWFRSYGNENWEFDEHGLMRLRIASINDLPINESERKYHWPLGRRPDDHPSLSELGL